MPDTSAARRVLLTGSRNWTDEDAVIDALVDQINESPHYSVVVIHGACPTGADAIADRFCEINADNRYFSIEAKRFPADWSLGKKAGPLRNQTMVDLGADVCLAFPLADSRGTRDCMRRAEAAGIPVIVIGGGDA